MKDITMSKEMIMQFAKLAIPRVAEFCNAHKAEYDLWLKEQLIKEKNNEQENKTI